MRSPSAGLAARNREGTVHRTPLLAEKVIEANGCKQAEVERGARGRPLLLVAAQPLADGGHGGLKEPGRGLDTRAGGHERLSGSDDDRPSFISRIRSK